ncbi:MAG TPA: DnaA/Hda family protein [Alteraurantiacibacter sp.]|jgi:hypothetical protein
MPHPGSQIALPLAKDSRGGPRRIVIGPANAHVAEALAAPENWPYRTAVLVGPPRSGKSLFARWFVASGHGASGGEAIDNAEQMDEAELFHRWNRAQESGTPLLIVSNREGWEIALPDLKSRLGAALHLEIGPPDDETACNLIQSLAEEHGVAFGEGAETYLVPRITRTWAAIERLVAEIDRLSLERKTPARISIWRDALEAVEGPVEPRLL